MGIDAEMLIRYRGEWPTDEQLTRWSWDICQAIGGKHFFIGDGLRPAEYKAASKAWHKAFNEHPLHADYQKQGHGEAAHKAILNDLGKHPNQLRRAIELTNTRYPLEDEDSDIPPEYRVPGKAWCQDGDPIFAEPGEYFLEVSLWTRYYGPGYERGDILLICAIAEWIEHSIQPSEVWYGGDSSGVCAEPFGAEARAKMKAHLYSPHGRDYFAYHDRRGTFPTPKPCGLCIPGENRFNRYGWGQNYIAVGCAGCGKNFHSHDNGKTWAEEKEDKP